MWTTMIASGLYTLAVFCLGWLCRGWYVSMRTPMERKSGSKFCDVCGAVLPASAVRTHHGKWLCAKHKVLA